MRYKKTLAYSLLGLGLSLNARADVPSVVVDIAPLHSLVHQVMQGVGEPSLIIPAEASPHSYTLRPSQAKAVAEAEIVFWIGQELTPWLEKSIDNLASSARVVSMLSTDGITNYAYRDQAIFEEHDHEDEHHDHHHDAVDPHAWLDPKNAKVWVEVIRSTLTAHDPVNANIYANNAERATASLDQLIDSVARQIEGIGALKFIVFHDAYQYFEKRFGILSQGSISLSDAKDPSPARIEAIQDAVKRLNGHLPFHRAAV